VAVLSGNRRLTGAHPLAAAAGVVIALTALIAFAWPASLRADDPGDRDELLGGIAVAANLVRSALLLQPHYSIAHPTGSRVELRASPDGPVIERLGPRTEFGSQRTFLVVQTRDEWVGVLAPELSNGQVGWLRRDSDEVEFSDTTYSVHVDLSERSLELRYGDELLRRAAVSVGRAGHDTPKGQFSVTDALAGRGLGPWYGCCALALSGHQPNLPPDWVGGDRVAIHGTPGPVGEAVSTGCIRATNEDMVALFADVPLGAPVFIRS
jgi:hypothetical protein